MEVALEDQRRTTSQAEMSLQEELKTSELRREEQSREIEALRRDLDHAMHERGVWRDGTDAGDAMLRRDHEIISGENRRLTEENIENRRQIADLM